MNNIFHTWDESGLCFNGSLSLFYFYFLLLYSLRGKYIMHYTLQSFSGMKLADTTNMNYCVFVVAPLLCLKGLRFNSRQELLSSMLLIFTHYLVTQYLTPDDRRSLKSFKINVIHSWFKKKSPKICVFALNSVWNVLFSLHMENFCHTMPLISHSHTWIRNSPTHQQAAPNHG